MPKIRSLDVKRGDALVLVGTMKGAFLLRAKGVDRSRWDVGGPYLAGQEVYSLRLAPHGDKTRVWAGGSSGHWGPGLHFSDDKGKTWTSPEVAPIRFPEDTGATLKRVWQIVKGRRSGVLYAGVEPAALFVSVDGGETWELNRGLWNHPDRERWQPGGGGLCMHTILPDPNNDDRITVAVSTGGVYRTDDGGTTWRSRNHGVRADFLPDKNPEFGQCVHKIVHHRSNPERLFLQNHWGLYRSDNGGDSWTDIANGVPSDFGFAMAMHPHDSDTVYIVPIESDTFRCTPEGKLRVYRTRNAGRSWEALTRGLPQQNALELVLRDGMDVDGLNPAGVYFGTRSGSVWGSADGGASWSEIASGLPPVICVKAAFVGDPAAAKPTRRRASAKRSGAKMARRSGVRAKSAARAKASARSARHTTKTRSRKKR